MKTDTFTLDEGVSLPDDAVIAGTETMSTCDGSVEVTKYTSASLASTFWVGNEDSGKKNMAVYKMDTSSMGIPAIFELTSYTLKAHVAYVPSPVIGQEYARYTSETGSSISAKYFAESSDYFCISDNTGLVPNYILLAKTVGDAPQFFADKGNTKVTVDGTSYDTKGYEKDQSVLSSPALSISSTVHADIYNDGVMYKLTVISSNGEYKSEESYTIVLP